MKVEKFKEKLLKAIQIDVDDITSERSMQKIGKSILHGNLDFKGIRQIARMGKSTDSEGNSAKFNPHSKQYKKFRKKMKKKMLLSPQTTPGKSNATLTGDLLDNLKYDVIKNKIVIEPGDEFGHIKAATVTKYKGPFLNMRKVAIKKLTKSLQIRLKILVLKNFRRI